MTSTEPRSGSEQGADEALAQWLADLAEHDYTMFLLKQLRDKVAKRGPLDLAIDKATGYEAALTAEAEELMARATELRLRLEAS